MGAGVGEKSDFLAGEVGGEGDEGEKFDENIVVRIGAFAVGAGDELKRKDVTVEAEFGERGVGEVVVDVEVCLTGGGVFVGERVANFFLGDMTGDEEEIPRSKAE